jgi:hypothetical protein
MSSFTYCCFPPLTLDIVIELIDVFKMIKWHQLTKTFKSPLLKDPQYPARPLAKTLKKKRDLLIKELLTSVMEVRDISNTVPLIAFYNIDFLAIIPEDIYKVILKARNIVLGINEILIAIL